MTSPRRRPLLAGTVLLTSLAAPLLVATPAQASDLGLAITVTSDGAGPFTDTDEPGGDTGSTNGIVRTNDTVTYRVEVSANAGDAADQVVELTAPSGTSWSGIPTQCTAAGSSIDGQKLVCSLGTLAGGSTRAIPVVVNVLGSLGNGTRLAVDATVSATDSAPVSGRSPVTTVSAAPRLDLAKNSQAPILEPGVTGPDGSRGIGITFPVEVTARSQAGGPSSRLGLETVTGDLTFRDDVSRLAGTAGGLNSRSRFDHLPGGSGGGKGNVRNSGTIRCTQSAAGAPVDVVISGADTSLASVPTQDASGTPIGVANRVVEMYISFWMPTPTDNDTFEAVNTFSRLQATSVSGQANYAEPLADNTATRTISHIAPGGGYKYLTRSLPSGMTAPGSGKNGDPYVTVGQILRSQVNLKNTGLGAYRSAVVCDVFDNRYQQLVKGGSSKAYATSDPGSTIRYAARTWTTADAARTATCGDADATWYDSPEDVPGGPTAVGMVRATADVAGGDSVNLFSYVSVKDSTAGTRIRDFGSLYFGTDLDVWAHDTTSADLAAGGLSDHVISTDTVARVSKKIVDPGSNASNTPDKTAYVSAGNGLQYALYPTLTNATKGAPTRDVTVQDVLPADETFVRGTASIDPVVDTVEIAGVTHQRLTWTLRDVEPGTAIEPILYLANVSEHAAPGALTNEVTVSAHGDVSPVELRSADRAVQVVTTGGITVTKRSIHPTVVAGDDLGWTLTYTNTDATPIDGVDLIDVIPHHGDEEHSEFHGSVGLAKPIATDSRAGETATYTAAAPATIMSDPRAESNQPGGSTTWCTLEQFGTTGCPADLAHVTGARVVRTAAVAVGQTVEHELWAATTGALDGDRYANRFGLAASNLTLPVTSAPAFVDVVAGHIGDTVWRDLDRDGLQGAEEPGVAGIRVALSGADDHGAIVPRATTTDKDGRYRFAGLRPGDYTVTFTAPDKTAWTKQRVGDDRTLDSDVNAKGIATGIALTAIRTEGEITAVDSTDDIDAGLLRRRDTADPVDDQNGGDKGTDRPGTLTPGPGTPGGTGTTSGYPAAAGSGAAPARLAFTGTTVGIGALVAGALAAVLGGAVLLRIRRRREEDAA